MAEIFTPQKSGSKKRIREIDGIRAIAIIAVLIYHARVGKYFSGGFLGVDMFFVISGYVITLSLRKSIHRCTFNYKEFVIRRLFRLTPALLATLLVTNIFCAALFSRFDRFRAARLSIGSLFSFSNFQLWMESNYFDVSSLKKPYLHTWSLSVEWQFYLTWALLVQVISKKLSSPGLQVSSILSIALLSIVATEMTRKIYPSAAFFIFCFRYVEFMCGAIPAWNISEENCKKGLGNSLSYYKSSLSFFSMTVILALLSYFKDNFPFPGLSSIPICIATTVLITQSPGTFIGQILTTSVLQWLGKISYSVYLVHWPVQVVISYAMLHHSTRSARVCGTLFSIFLGYLLNIAVELPFQESSDGSTFLSRNRKFAILGFGIILLNAETSYMWKRNIGISLKTPEITKIIENSWKLAGARGEEIRPKCRSIGRHDNLRHWDKCNPTTDEEFVLVGDSHAADLWFSLNYTFPHVSTIQICGTGCGLHRYHESQSGCGKIFGAYQKKLRKRRSRIRAAILVSKWHVLRNESIGNSVLNSFVTYFKHRTNATIFILGPRPEFKPHPNEVFERSRMRETVDQLEIRSNKFKTVENNSELVLYNYSVKKKVRFLSIPQVMCNATRIGQPSNEYFCPTIHRGMRSSLYCDTTHYNRAGAMTLVEKMRPELEDLLKHNT